MTKEKWSALCGKGQWDVLVALRGPDVYYSDTIKWFTTSVIRGAMVGVIRIGGMVNYAFNVVVLPDGSPPGLNALLKNPSIPSMYKPSLEHFLHHVREAAQWLDIPTLTVKAPVWEVAMSAPAQTAARLIVEQFPPITDGSGVSLRPEVKAIAEWVEEGTPVPSDGPFGYPPPPYKASPFKKTKVVNVKD